MSETSGTVVSVHSASGKNTGELFESLTKRLSSEECAAPFVFVFYGVEHDATRVHQGARRAFPEAALLGGSSNGGALTLGAGGPDSIAFMVLQDSLGDFGTACLPKGEDPGAAAEAALLAAIEDADCAGELPDLVWVYQSPGGEEAVLDGLRRVVGDRCPIVGGSSADEDLSGGWSQLATNATNDAGIAVGAFFPSGPVEIVFQGGYEPNGCSGQVTAIAGATAGASTGRIIREIDGKPAAEVYNAWTHGQISWALAEGGNVLADTTMFPLAIPTGFHEGLRQYLLVHPEAILPDGSLSTFADVPLDARLMCMTGDKSRLVDRAGSVAAQACALRPKNQTPAGAIVVYCAGCRMAIGADDANLKRSIEKGLHGAPFIGCFTYGEQGPLAGVNVHGNLMISAVVFW